MPFLDQFEVLTKQFSRGLCLGGCFLAQGLHLKKFLSITCWVLMSSPPGRSLGYLGGFNGPPSDCAPHGLWLEQVDPASQCGLSCCDDHSHLPGDPGDDSKKLTSKYFEKGKMVFSRSSFSFLMSQNSISTLNEPSRPCALEGDGIYFLFPLLRLVKGQPLPLLPSCASSKAPPSPASDFLSLSGGVSF